MTATVKICYLLLIYCTVTHAISDEYILDEDRPYEVLEIKVPPALWEQALNPAPVLKSPVTVVVPVYVPSEDDYIVNDPETEVNDSENELVTEQIAQVTASPINDQEVLQEGVTPNSPVADVTQNPSVQQDGVAPTEAQQPATGSLIRFPCSCIQGQCGCCTGAILQRFQTKACGNITFIPEDFMFDVKLSLNNNTVVRRRVSASDPPPICFNPRRAPFITVCAEISNIRIRNRNAFACLDINADIGGFPVYSASFRCFGLGASGVQTGLKPKPASSGPAPVNLFGSGNNDDADDEGFLGNAADALGVGGGLFGGGSDDDAGGPLDAIGDAVGDFFDGRKMN